MSKGYSYSIAKELLLQYFGPNGTRPHPRLNTEPSIDVGPLTLSTCYSGPNKREKSLIIERILSSVQALGFGLRETVSSSYFLATEHSSSFAGIN